MGHILIMSASAPIRGVCLGHDIDARRPAAPSGVRHPGPGSAAQNGVVENLEFDVVTSTDSPTLLDFDMC